MRIHFVVITIFCTLFCIAFAGGTLSTANAATIGANFTGSYSYQSGFAPPDTDGAIGPSHFVELINGRYAVYNRTTGALVQSSSLSTFWNNAGGGFSGAWPYDPRVVYDPNAQRYYAVAADNAGGVNNFLLAVSNTSNPTQGWTSWKIASDSDGNQWADYPTLGFNSTGVYLSANMFGVNTGDPFGVTVVAANKANLLAGSLTYAKVENSAVWATSQQTVDLDNVSASASIWSAGSNYVRHDPITYNTGTNTIGFGSASFIGTTYHPGPPEARQPGTTATLDTLDGRLHSNVTKIGGVVWGTQVIDVDGRSGIRWFKISASTSQLLQEGLISNPDMDYFFGSIAANELGDAVIGFTGSSDVLGPQGQKYYASSYAVVGDSLSDNPLNTTTFNDPMLLKAGSGTYGSGSGERWGDYSATTLDPNNHYHFWTIQEFTSATNTWATQITEVIVPEPSTLALLSLAAAGLFTWTVRKRRRSM